MSLTKPVESAGYLIHLYGYPAPFVRAILRPLHHVADVVIVNDPDEADLNCEDKAALRNPFVSKDIYEWFRAWHKYQVWWETYGQFEEQEVEE